MSVNRRKETPYCSRSFFQPEKICSGVRLLPTLDAKKSDTHLKVMLADLPTDQLNIQIHVCVVRFFNRVGFHPQGKATNRTLKEVCAVDYILSDERGTLILAAIYSDAVRDELMPQLFRGRCYSITGFSVVSGGLCLHQCHHLEFTSSTVVQDADYIPCPPVYNLKTVSDLPWRLTDTSGFFDLCGYIKYFSPLRMSKFMGYCEKELTLILETRMKDRGWAKDQVQCVLRGSWVEELERRLVEGQPIPCSVFILLCCVISTEPTALGLPTVSSWGNATTYVYDPTYPEVMELKQQMMTLPH